MALCVCVGRVLFLSLQYAFLGWLKGRGKLPFRGISNIFAYLHSAILHLTNPPLSGQLRDKHILHTGDLVYDLVGHDKLRRLTLSVTYGGYGAKGRPCIWLERSPEHNIPFGHLGFSTSRTVHPLVWNVLGSRCPEGCN